MKRLVAICSLAAAAAACLPAAARASNEYPVKRTLNATVPAGGVSALNVTGLNGDVNVYADNGNTVRVRTVIRARTVQDADAITVNASRSGNAIAVQATCPATRHVLFWSFADCAIDYDIYYPRSLALNLKNDNGDIVVENSSGAVSVQMDNGDIDVKNVASNVSVALAHGDITVSLANGWHGNSIAMKASAGDLELTVPRGFSGTLDSHTRFGDVTDNAGLHGGRAKVSATVTFGDVTIRRS